MAASHGFIILVLLLASTAPTALDAANTNDGTTHLHFFMHDIVAGSNPTAVQIIKGPASFPTAPKLGLSFGDANVFDDPLTTTSSPTAPPVGRIQGTYMLAAQSAPVLMVTANIVLTSGEFNGSSIAVMGRDDTALDVRELPVVGGTGKFRMAKGYVLWKVSAFKGPDATIELDVHVANSNGDGTAVDASAPISAGSSGSSRMMAVSSFAGKWVVAVSAAVVASCWV